jgi:hypothetical protein
MSASSAALRATAPMWEKIPTIGSTARQHPPGGGGLAHQAGAAVAPAPPDDVAPVDLGADLGHRRDLLIAPALDRVAEARPVLGEQPPGGVPVLAQMGMGAAVGGQFGAGRDAGEQGVQPDLMGPSGGSWYSTSSTILGPDTRTM